MKKGIKILYIAIYSFDVSMRIYRRIFKRHCFWGIWRRKL